MSKVIILENELKRSLKKADEIWVAVALMSEYGLQLIKNNIKESCKENYLIGINLPTPTTVLRKLQLLSQSEKISCRIFTIDRFFHPKLYITRREDNYKAFIGSANCTEGGLKSNIELNFKINNSSVCQDLLNNYYLKYYRIGTEISDSFLANYQEVYLRRRIRVKQDQQEIKELLKPSKNDIDFESIDFTAQFFKYEHFNAFKHPKPIKDSADKEREKVGGKLLELDELIWPKIKRRKWNLHRHPDKPHRHSTTVLSSAKTFNLNKLQSVWLHYGKSKPELKPYLKISKQLKKGVGLSEIFPQTFIHHIRIQIIIRQNLLGVWLVIGKNNGSHYDREYFRTKMKNSNQYREKIFSSIKNLDRDYSIYLAGEKRGVTDFKTANELWTFTRKDDIKDYFRISKNFKPGDPQISKQNIVKTIIREFEKLYPIYVLTKHSL